MIVSMSCCCRNYICTRKLWKETKTKLAHQCRAQSSVRYTAHSFELINQLHSSFRSILRCTRQGGRSRWKGATTSRAIGHENGDGGTSSTRRHHQEIGNQQWHETRRRRFDCNNRIKCFHPHSPRFRLQSNTEICVEICDVRYFAYPPKISVSCSDENFSAGKSRYFCWKSWHSWSVL